MESDVGMGSERSDQQKNIVIVGGGFAGVTLARALERRLPTGYDIFLLSQTDYITFNPLLPEVVGASVLPSHVVVPLRRLLRRTRIRMVEVTGIDLEARRISYSQPIRDSIPFEHLVLAAGLDANVHAVPGIDVHGLPLKTLGDAMHLRNRVIGCLEEATLTYDVEKSRRLTSFAVVGGGFSGVEVAGEIHDLLREAAPLFKRVRPDDCQVHILHAMPHLLPEVSESLGRYTERVMSKRGVRVHLNAQVEAVDATGVVMKDGTRIEAATVVSTVGTQAHAFIASLPFADARGRIPVDGSLAVPGQDRVWALGDCAVVPNARTGKPSPTTAQFAVPQAQVLAANLVASLAGKPLKNFSFISRGQLAAVGHRKAVAEVFGLRLGGMPAWLLWRAFYLARIPTIAWKVRLFLEWSWTTLFKKDISLVDFERSRTHSAHPPV
ncbi:MAG: NAD(P)/FAD-dependent oxidoreductase [Pseudomonadales bacterium]|jgi:NADH dehydrogenase